MRHHNGNQRCIVKKGRKTGDQNRHTPHKTLIGSRLPKHHIKDVGHNRSLANHISNNQQQEDYCNLNIGKTGYDLFGSENPKQS